MRKLIYKSLALFLVITHLATFGAQDLALAGDNSAKGGAAKPPSADSKTSSSKPSADSSQSSTPQSPAQELKPPDKGTRPKDAVGWMPQTRSLGSNLSLLQSLQSDPFTGRATFTIPIE